MGLAMQVVVWSVMATCAIAVQQSANTREERGRLPSHTYARVRDMFLDHEQSSSSSSSESDTESELDSDSSSSSGISYCKAVLHKHASGKNFRHGTMNRCWPRGRCWWPKRHSVAFSDHSASSSSHSGVHGGQWRAVCFVYTCV